MNEILTKLDGLNYIKNLANILGFHYNDKNEIVYREYLPNINNVSLIGDFNENDINSYLFF